MITFHQKESFQIITNLYFITLFFFYNNLFHHCVMIGAFSVSSLEVKHTKSTIIIINTIFFVYCIDQLHLVTKSPSGTWQLKMVLGVNDCVNVHFERWDETKTRQ